MPSENMKITRNLMDINAELKAEIERLTAENQSLFEEDEVIAWRTLRAENARLQAENAALQGRINMALDFLRGEPAKG